MLIAVEGLRHGYGAAPVVDLPSWSVPEGRHCLVLGPSGSGKTTLFNILAGLIRPERGRVTVAGQAIAELAPDALDRFRGRTVGIVFQTLHLVKALSVADNLRLARYLAGLAPDDGRILGVLAALGLADKARRRPRDLSQGEAQRVAIARAVINGPKLILADEPTSALDDASCARVVDLLTEQARDCGATLVIATHDARVRDRFDLRLDMGGRS